MKIAIFGNTLYAAVMSALLAEYGHSVFVCNDLEHSAHFYETREQDIIDAIDRQVRLGFLKFCDFQHLPFEIDAYIFSFNHLQQRLAIDVVNKISRRPLIHPKLMINTSTFGLEGTSKLKEILNQDYWLYLPDIIQEGQALKSVLVASKIIVGSDDAKAEPILREMLRPLFPRPEQYQFMPVLDAEFTKISISGMLATRVSYINDLAVVAEKVGVDIENVRTGMAADSRIGASYLFPGVGFGGENFSHDIQTLTDAVANTGIKSQLLAQVWEINEQQKEYLFRKLWKYFHGQLNGKTVAIWGAAFKPNTSRTNHSPIHAMLNALWAQNVTVKLHDPQALNEIKQHYGQRDDLIYCEDQYEAVEGAHALCLLTAWKQYGALDYPRLKRLLAHPLILDGRNVYNPEYIKEQGFAYVGVGRS